MSSFYHQTVAQTKVSARVVNGVLDNGSPYRTESELELLVLPAVMKAVREKIREISLSGYSEFMVTDDFMSVGSSYELTTNHRYWLLSEVVRLLGNEGFTTLSSSGVRVERYTISWARPKR